MEAAGAPCVLLKKETHNAPLAWIAKSGQQLPRAILGCVVYNNDT
jgi:hypothetical protein